MEVAAIILSITKFITTKITLTPDEITFITNLVKDNPEVFQTVADSINTFAEKKSITVMDIPDIVAIISSVYKNNLKIQDHTMDLIDIVEFTTLALFYGDVFKLSDAVNTEIEKLIKVSIVLLRTNMKQKKKCFSWLKSFIFPVSKK